MCKCDQVCIILLLVDTPVYMSVWNLRHVSVFMALVLTSVGRCSLVQKMHLRRRVAWKKNWELYWWRLIIGAAKTWWCFSYSSCATNEARVHLGKSVCWETPCKITLFEIFIFCSKIQLWFLKKMSFFFLGEKLAKMLWFWAF